MQCSVCHIGCVHAWMCSQSARGLRIQSVAGHQQSMQTIADVYYLADGLQPNTVPERILCRQGVRQN